MALQVEKTSKRGGRIIHEKEIMPPPLMDFPAHPLSPGFSSSPTSSSQKDGKTDTSSITELMKTPSKVVLLKVKFVHNIFIFCIVFSNDNYVNIFRTWLDQEK